MRFNKFIIISILCMTVFMQGVLAQEQKETLKENVTLEEFLHLVSSNNLEYAAEKLNINISEAELKASKVFPDPTLAIDYTDNKEDNTYVGHAYTYELSTTLELGGKRRARIDIANSHKAMADAILKDYFRNLKANASIAFLESLKTKQLYLIALDSYNTMKQLSKADSIQLSLGNIAKIDAIQSKLETGVLSNELLQSEVDYSNSIRELSILTGEEKEVQPKGKLNKSCKVFNVNTLSNQALNNRADLEVLKQNNAVSDNELKLARREQLFDMDVKISLENSYAKTASSPVGKALTAGISIPLQFSNLNRGKIRMAKFKLEQTEIQYKHTELSIKIEVQKAWAQYNTSCKQVRQYEQGLLSNAKEVLDGKIYSYKRGETSLLEVLNAQRTYNDVRIAYCETIFNNAVAFVELERTVGL